MLYLKPTVTCLLFVCIIALYNTRCSYAQSIGSKLEIAKSLDSQAKWLYQYGSKEDISSAIGIWKQSSYLFESVNANNSNQLQYIANAYHQLNQKDSALNYYGRYLSVYQDGFQKKIENLALSNPMFQPFRGDDEIDFILEVRSTVSVIPYKEMVDISSSIEAQEILEMVFVGRKSKMIIKSETKDFSVSFKRWIHRNNKFTLWTPVVTDTTLWVDAAAYQLKYTSLTTKSDTTINILCADGCVIKLPIN